MLEIPAKTVYVDPAVYDLPNCRERIERVMPFIRCDDVREYNDAARETVRNIGSRRHGKDGFADDAVLVFTTYETGREGFYYHWRDEAGAHGGYCQPGMELNLVNGCMFRCAYCGFGRSITFPLDVERFIEGIGQVFTKHPEQRLYKYSNMTDLPPFEPELDAVRPVVERFARESDRYVMLFTKSDNVDFLRDTDHRGQTIISWSISCDTSSRLIDARAATMEQRIDAMAAMQACGYIVRARLSPIVPIKDWRREYTELFETMFARAKPDIVTMELLGWMDVDDVKAIIPPDMIDPDALRDAEESREELAEHNWGPFTQATHEEVYRFCIETVKRISPETPVSVCHGTPDTWDALGGMMRMTPGNYLCNCGPMSAPGGELYREMVG